MTPPTSARKPLKQIDFLVLAVLEPEPLHGYGVVQALEEATDGRVTLRPGDVYRVLYRLHRQGLIEPVDLAEHREDERRSYYRITDRGRRAARAEAELLAGVSERLLAGRQGGSP